MKRIRISLAVIFCVLLFLLNISASAYDTSDLTIPATAERIVYGTSGAGRELTAYRFGTGENVMVVGFAIHGYEDNFDKDGGALVYTAGLLMDLLEENLSTVRDYGWSIYVLPCMNPDGLIDGTANNGPGRCTTTYLNTKGTLITGPGKGIDMNRSFPYRWTPYTDDRNFNGLVPLASMESWALDQFIQSVKGSGVNLCLDVHGWLNQIIPSNGTASKLYSILKQAFPGATYANLMNGKGYFGAYAASLGYTACLFEFPGNIYSLNQFRASGYGEAFNNCILELAKAYGTMVPTSEPVPEPEETLVHGAACAANRFTDVEQDAWYHGAVDFALEQGLLIGTSQTTFSPDVPLTRAMLATILYRLSGTQATAESTFPDVPAGAWYAEAVGWAQACGIVTGFPDGTFGPNQEINREQLAVVFHRFVQWAIPTAAEFRTELSQFPDRGLVGEYALEAMNWAVAVGLLQGCPDGDALCLNPLGWASRAEVAQVLQNYDVAMHQTALAQSEAVLLSEEETMSLPDGSDLGGN